MNVEAIQASLEENGLRCTPQRLAVMAYLLASDRHPTASEIYAAINRRHPRSTHATIYNNLRDLVRAGLVREVAVEGRAARFDARDVPHHHFICQRCGKVEDLDWYAVPRPAADALGKRVLHEYEIIFRGLCTRCSAHGANGATPAPRKPH